MNKEFNIGSPFKNTPKAEKRAQTGRALATWIAVGAGLLLIIIAALALR